VSRFLCLAFFAAAKKVSAAPHRGDANRPLRTQGKAKNPEGKAKHPDQGKPNATGRQTNKTPRRQTNQIKTSAAGIQPKRAEQANKIKQIPTP
jgi:hypothetical protein